MTERQQELYHLCERAEKLSIDGELFTIDGCTDSRVFLYSDEEGDELNVTYRELEKDEQYGSKVEFYELKKIEQKP